MDIQREGYGDHIICVKDTGRKVNPYLVYRKWYDMGWHKKKLTAYADYRSAVWLAAEIMTGRMNIEEVME